MVLASALVSTTMLAGCGGGGGSSNNTNPGNGNGGTTTSTITGRVVNSGATGIANASVTIGGRTVQTGTDGTFTISGVAVGATSIKVTAPAGTGYSNVANYLSKDYDLGNCNLPLSATVAGTNALPGNIRLYGALDPVNAPPPPPPTDGCPS